MTHGSDILPAMTAVADAIRANTYRFANEDELQRGIDLALGNADIQREREVRLAPGDRIDFMCGLVGIEVKVDGSISALSRQLLRYAMSGRVGGLVVVTSRMRQAVQLPARLNDKPLSVITVGGFA